MSATGLLPPPGLLQPRCRPGLMQPLPGLIQPLIRLAMMHPVGLIQPLSAQTGLPMKRIRQPWCGTKFLKTHGKIEQSGETTDREARRTTCAKITKATNNYADGADHDADEAMVRITTITTMTVMMMMR